jgi:hypothetical protein
MQGWVNTTRRGLALIGLLGLSACASVPSDAPGYSRLADPDGGYSHLYFYRLGAYPKLRTPSVLVDSKLIFDPPEGAYTVITLPAGVHAIKIDWAADTGWPDLEFSVTLNDRGFHYLKITGSSEVIGNKLRMGSRVVRMSQDEAEREIRECCRYIAPNK